MTLDPALAQAFETTWPAAEYHDIGGFRVGRGLGGGGRISSARALGPDWHADGIEAAAQLQRDWDQPETFRVWSEETALADALTARGFRQDRPTLVMAVEAAQLTDREIPLVTVFPIWPPLAIQREIWAEGNIAGPRQAAMERVAPLPHTSLLGRIEDHASASAFVAADGDVAMIHAIEVEPKMRRKGMADWLLRGAAHWARDHDASRLALAVTAANAPAIALYEKLGFAPVARYGYWSR
ncbi:GNAT family N-acetyltransferase [Paracoccus aminophilus]|uniref:GCN5-related N-acetyltransferase n=1 Tax=Paracoccus aminophilus JCM 7686 TaxID=1367847 RepID=S5XW96_PARAH|nr:GNAT family N-acetyltransferase [Paracoccus aminophilus]AGT07665.1 GCN5-related N-acetyltransferase [Paracoccus aminophilus JCM 7686]